MRSRRGLNKNSCHVSERFWRYVSVCWRFCKHIESKQTVVRRWRLTQAGQGEWWTCKQPRWAHVIYRPRGPQAEGSHKTAPRTAGGWAGSYIQASYLREPICKKQGIIQKKKKMLEKQVKTWAWNWVRRRSPDAVRRPDKLRYICGCCPLVSAGVRSEKRVGSGQIFGGLNRQTWLREWKNRVQLCTTSWLCL